MANYKLQKHQVKGMMWGKMTDNYNLSMGYAANISGMIAQVEALQLIATGYAESHDEERLMYKNLQFRQCKILLPNVKNLDVALSRICSWRCFIGFLGQR
jgi:hypothetical protein